ncbi:MAG: hypothetical protein ACTSWW_04930 [Promethearchaeota archaeon]
MKTLISQLWITMEGKTQNSPSSSDHTNESIVLARMRTLLALERNLLAEMRTYLAEFRTGLALALIGPPLLSLSLSFLTFSFLNFIIYAFLTVLTIWGVYMAFKAQKTTKAIRAEHKHIIYHEKQLVENNLMAKKLLADCMFLWEREKKEWDHNTPLT